MIETLLRLQGGPKARKLADKVYEAERENSITRKVVVNQLR